MTLLSKSFFWSSDSNSTKLFLFTPTYVKACTAVILESMLMGMLGWLRHTIINSTAD